MSVPWAWRTDWKLFFPAAEHLQRMLPNAQFVLVGEGAEKKRMVEMAAQRGLTNVDFLGQLPRQNIPAIVSAADICVVTLKKTDLFKTVIPTKLLEYMACERPVIVAVDGQARQILEDAQAGVFVPPEDSLALANAICDLAQNPERRRQMGANGRRYIMANLSRERTARKYIAVLQQLVPSEEPNRSAA